MSAEGERGGTGEEWGTRNKVKARRIGQKMHYISRKNKLNSVRQLYM